MTRKTPTNGTGNPLLRNKALHLEKTLKDKGFEAQIVWVKSDGTERDDDDAFEPFEAVVVREFLNRYDVIHEM